MSASLPERPDLEQLRRQAKQLRDAARSGDVAALQRLARHRPSASQHAVGLAVAQLVIARELGYPSWPKLKIAIDVDAARRAIVDEFVAASVDGRVRQASGIFGTHPDIASRSLLAASVLGDAEKVREFVTGGRSAAVTVDDERGWPPLLYACYSRWHQIEPHRAAGLAEVVRILLGAGASPRTNDGGRPQYRSALKGSVEVSNPAITEVLLDAGADPDDGQCIAEAAGNGCHRCLELLLSHGARVVGTWALGAAVWGDDPVAMVLLLDAVARSGVGVADRATEALTDAAANASLPVVEALLAAGADPRAIDQDGVSVLQRAVRAGRLDTAARLRCLGATAEGTDIDQFLGACLNADRSAAERLLAEQPDLRDRLGVEDRALIVDAASSRPAATIALMLDLGFSTHDRNDFGEVPMHSAAYAGNAEVVRLLLERGAEVDVRDARFEATPLAFATVGSGEQPGKPGDWIQTVRLLVDAGASRNGAWISGKPPSDEVMDLVRLYGITLDEPHDHEKKQDNDPPVVAGTGVMADVACHLEAAYRDFDLDLLESLLHPQVRWTGLCGNRAEVLDWYRGLVADGTRADVESVEVDRNAVLLRLSAARQAEGARPAPPQRLYQVFTVEDGQVVEIRGYSDRASALARI
jgi:ankyrin repeat protein